MQDVSRETLKKSKQQRFAMDKRKYICYTYQCKSKQVEHNKVQIGAHFNNKKEGYKWDV